MSNIHICLNPIVKNKMKSLIFFNGIVNYTSKIGSFATYLIWLQKLHLCLLCKTPCVELLMSLYIC